MDQTTLVSPDVNTGQEILMLLEASEIKLVVALLMVSSDYEDWRLVLSSPSLDQEHSRKAYEKVVDILHGRFVYTLPQILILPVKDHFIRELRKRFGKAKAVTGMRLGGQRIGNRFVNDAYVYKVE